MIHSLNAHMITTVPISTFYEILELPSHDYFRDFYLPMLRLNAESKALMREMITRRVDESLFAQGVLDRFVEMSGGCPRILLKLVNRGILSAKGQQVQMEHADKAILQEGNERWRALTAKHREILKSGEFDTADREILELLHSLNVLEYNGSKPERKINPLIAVHLEELT